MENSVFSGIFEIIVGTYEEFVLGYSFKDEPNVELVESFSSHAHQSSVRCVAVNNRFLASGGSDEHIQLYDMINRKGVGTIMQHTGTITCLKFTPEGHHLMTASQDGSICIFRLGSWILEKVWSSAHKGTGVNSLDVHPNSKLAFSIGKNKTLRTWNLVKGRPAYTTNFSSFGKYIDSVVFSTRGTYFGLSIDNNVYILSIETAGITANIHSNSRVTCLTFIEDDVICFGVEGGIMICYNVTLNSELWRKKVSDVRVKCMSAILSKWLITACSDGQISVWKLLSTNVEPELTAVINASCRITCMDVRIPIKLEGS